MPGRTCSTTAHCLYPVLSAIFLLKKNSFNREQDESHFLLEKLNLSNFKITVSTV